MANEMEIKTVKDEIDNTELIEAIKTMRANFCAETQNKVINITLRSSFYVPAIFSKKTELVTNADNRLEFKDNPQARFILIEHPEKGRYFPAFTELDLLKSFDLADQEARPFAMKFADLATLTERTPNVNGFIINPNREALPYTKAMLADIKGVLKKAKEDREAAEAGKSKPNITMTTNENPEV
ncbi:MAG: SseB family protein [Ruminococcus sp.]|nr:SseB family protein [Ruminococcus sp.]